jgi:hypothetical protein
MRFFLARWRKVEEELAEAHKSYRSLLAAHNATFDRRLKNALRSLFFKK